MSDRSGRRLVMATTVPNTLLRLALPQAHELRRAGWQVALVSSPGDWLDDPTLPGPRFGIPMHRGVSPAADVPALVRWVDLLRRLAPDVVLGSTPKAGLLSMTAARLTGVPRRIFLHRGARWETVTGPGRRLLMQMDRLTMSAANEVLAVSPSLADLVLAEGLTDSRPTVLGAGGSRGVDLERFHPAPAPAGRPPTLGFVGRLTADKGLDSLLGVFDALGREFPELRLTIAGALDETDPVPTWVRDRIVSDPAIDWRGRVEEMPGFYASVDVLLFPSAREGLPNVVIEAAACGVPTVGWAVTGVKDAVDSGRTGLVVAQGDTDALARAAADVLRWDRGTTVEQCWDFAAQFDERRLTGLFLRYLTQGPGRTSSVPAAAERTASRGSLG